MLITNKDAKTALVSILRSQLEGFAGRSTVEADTRAAATLISKLIEDDYAAINEALLFLTPERLGLQTEHGEYL